MQVYLHEDLGTKFIFKRKESDKKHMFLQNEEKQLSKFVQLRSILTSFCV